MSPTQQLANDPEVRRHFRRRLVDARATALADSEAAEAVIFAIEHLGRFVAQKDKSLESLTKPLLKWVGSALPSRKPELDRRLELLVDSPQDPPLFGDFRRSGPPCSGGLHRR